MHGIDLGTEVNWVATSFRRLTASSWTLSSEVNLELSVRFRLLGRLSSSAFCMDILAGVTLNGNMCCRLGFFGQFGGLVRSLIDYTVDHWCLPAFLGCGTRTTGAGL